VLAGLHIAPGAVQTMDLDTLSFDTLVDSQIAFLQSIGLIDIPHVWGDILLPASRTERFVRTSLAELTAADLGPAGFVLLFPIRNRFQNELAFRLPREEKAFLFDILTSGLATDPSYAPTEIAKARARFESARAIGGTLYPIGSTPMSTTDWAIQYGAIYPRLLQAKARFDPAHIMTPGAGIF
jgi:cytokinin dehydrogenase